MTHRYYKVVAIVAVEQFDECICTALDRIDFGNETVLEVYEHELVLTPMEGTK